MNSHRFIKILLLTVCSVSLAQASSLQRRHAPFLNQNQSISDSSGANATLNEVFEQDSTGMKARLENVQKARKLKETGETMESMGNEISGHLGTFGRKIVSKGETPYELAAGNAFKIIGTTIQVLGTVVGRIVQGVARYKNSLLTVQSTNEQLIRGIEDSFYKIEQYSDQLETLSTKRLTLKTGNSLTDRFKNIFKPSAWKGSVQDLLDKTYLTDFKGQRLEEALPLQQALKMEKENFEDLVRLLQIKLLEQFIKDKMMELHPDQAQFQVERDLATLQEAKKQTIQKISQMDPVKNKTQRAQLMLTLKDLDQKVRAKQAELDRLLNTHLTQEKITQLEQEIAVLRKEIKPIYELTRLYKGQQTEVKKACCPEEFRALQNQINALKDEVNALKNSSQKQTTPSYNRNQPRPMGMTQDSNYRNGARKLPALPQNQYNRPAPVLKTPYRWQHPQNN